MRRDTDKLGGAYALLTYCVFGTGVSLLILLLGWRWNWGNMELQVSFVVIALLSIFGLYKAVRILAEETADKVEFDKKYQLQECRLQFSQRTSFPGLEEVGHLTHKPFKTKDNFEFEVASDRLEEKYWTGSEGIGNMLGYAFLIQKLIVKDLSNHVLLLQLESSEYWQEDDKTPHDLMFGDGGIIYFYIKREDLRARRFDSIIFARQCY